MRDKMRERLKKMWVAFKKDWQLDLMILLPLIYVLVFYYAPMFGLQIAFRDYSPRDGIIGSDWVGFDNFVNSLETINGHSMCSIQLRYPCILFS